MSYSPWASPHNDSPDQTVSLHTEGQGRSLRQTSHTQVNVGRVGQSESEQMCHAQRRGDHKVVPQSGIRSFLLVSSDPQISIAQRTLSRVAVFGSISFRTSLAR